MAGLLDFIQGASNAAASNVAGPVDLINAGLLGLGLPMPAAPFGGTQWMRDKGLIRDPQNRMIGLLGEAAGMSLPIVAAAKAPQIAQGLLNHAENYRQYHAATTAPGAPATVWHGSPHKFDKFDAAHIGKGEGAQAYGHGLYFADSPDVAKSYAPRDLKYEEGLMRLYKQAEARSNYSAMEVLESAMLHNTPSELRAQYGAAADSVIKQIERIPRTSGHLYKVDLPDDAIARMLDWDAPLSQQPEVVRMLGGKGAPSDPLSVQHGWNAGGVSTWEKLVREHGGGRQAADFLRQHGIPGIRYLDGGSRGADAGTSNYVVFPGNEGLLKILGRE